MVKRVILKNPAKQDKAYIREIRHLTTGLDIFYGNEQQAFRYATWTVGVDMARSLYLRGDFKIIEVDD